ncbi:unnamed protein product [Brachionus calyciflorus]|uniref:Uncharacterized protein n=1 Tax=Brachionus calyciflorus TaxID=104777 RepID=A0A814A8C8_9BILA|nr:unnamed protein product [Brachionus calyciflorus]
MSLQQRKTSLPSRPINTRIPQNKNVSSPVSNNSSFISDVSNLSTIRSDSMSSISSTRSSDRTLTKPKVSNPSDFDLKKDSSEDLIKKIENLVSRNKILEEENNVLKNLINEESKTSSHCDERRILMLKCQIYQLEKQINVLSKSISFRKLAHTDTFNTLSILTESFRSIIHNSEAKSLTPTKSYNIEKNEFIKWIEMGESAKLKLIKAQNENEYDANSSIESLLFESNFSNKEINILDVCSGNLGHVNLKKIGLLESNMSQLYKNLNRLRESLKTVRNLKNDESKINCEINNSKKKMDKMPLHNESVKNQLDESLKKTSEVCRDLFDLSLLVPSAPWGAIKKSPIEDLSENALMNKLKAIGLPKTKHQSVEILLKSLFISSNYHYHMKTQECTALNEELTFYRSCYSVQKSYVESITDLFRSKYEQFIKELTENIRDPLKILINKFWLMKEKSTEDNLKEFLSLFKSYTKIFDKVIQSFEFIPNDNVVNTTFDKLMLQIDTEINRLNETLLNKMEQISLEESIHTGLQLFLALLINRNNPLYDVLPLKCYHSYANHLI